MKKYFEILELDMSASIEAVEKAYKELTAAWRPEQFQNMPRFRRKAEIKLKEINDAYERVKSFLKAKDPDKVQQEQQEKLAFEDGRSEYMHENPASEKTVRQQIRMPLQKRLLFGFIAILAVFGALMLYLSTDRKKSATRNLQVPDAEIKKAAPVAALGQKPTDQLKKGMDPGPEGKFSAEKRPASVNTAVQDPPLQKQPGYDGRLTIKALRRYNHNPVRVKSIQNGLITVGYDPGPIDGVIGPLTLAALKRFANDRGYVIETGGPFASDFTGAVLVFAEVAAAHPDWDRIIISEDFARWLGSQTHISAAKVKKLKKSATARQIVEILDLYKSDKKSS